MNYITQALAALEANHKHHADYDDLEMYAESDLYEQNVKAISELRAALAQPANLVSCRYGDSGYACCEGRPCEADVHNDALLAAQPAKPVEYQEGCKECADVKQVREFDAQWHKDVAKGREILAAAAKERT